ncbi:MAG TPA: farnesyl diphosphate synthase [Bacillota bacterium]|nr:farnesyl diphosphate synthase [Bacillota bacterium]
MVSLDTYIKTYQEKINQALEKAVNPLKEANRLTDGMLYSLRAGGKRLRPILLMASFESFQEDTNKVMSTATALEMIHTYSLIHDDLPAMDDDDLRRGKPTNHIVFDEATAILAGDGLLTYSFEWIAQDPLLSATEKTTLISWLAKASGPTGMVAGQMLDLLAEDKRVTIDELEKIHRLKTGQLINFAIKAGAFLGGATQEQLDELHIFSTYIGLVFQIQDDILDIVGDEETLGKPVGSDEENEKSTYPALLGLDGAIKHRDNYVAKAYEALENVQIGESKLFDLTKFLTERKY